MKRITRNFLKDYEKYTLCRAIDERTERIKDWATAEEVMSEVVGVRVTRSNIEAAIKSVGKKYSDVIETADFATVFTLQKSINDLEARLAKLEADWN